VKDVAKIRNDVVQIAKNVRVLCVNVLTDEKNVLVQLPVVLVQIVHANDVAKTSNYGVHTPNRSVAIFLLVSNEPAVDDILQQVFLKYKN
jgi:hypothetical protein